MSFSFLVQDGDLVLSGNSLKTVYGLEKLKQDMSLWVAERYGIDRFHPEMGSQLQSYIGGVVDRNTSNIVSQEIYRVIDGYQRMQLAAFRANPQLFSLSEMLASIDAVNISINYDTVQAAVQFTNGVGNSAAFSATASV